MGGVLRCRLAQEAEAAALAKEQEANGMLPLLEEHERTLGPLQNEAMTHQRCTAVPAPLCACPKCPCTQTCRSVGRC